MAYENLYTRVDPELKKRIDEYCHENNVTVKKFVEDAVTEKLDKNLTNS